MRGAKGIKRPFAVVRNWEINDSPLGEPDPVAVPRRGKDLKAARPLAEPLGVVGSRPPAPSAAVLLLQTLRAAAVVRRLRSLQPSLATCAAATRSAR